MILRNCEDFTYGYGGKLLTAYSTDGGGMAVNQLRLKVGDHVVLVVEDKIFDGQITQIEKPFNGEYYEEIDAFSVDDVEFSIADVMWLGVLN